MNSLRSFILGFALLGLGPLSGTLGAGSVTLTAAAGNQIVTLVGNCPVNLHGVDVAGLEYSCTGDGPTGTSTKNLESVQEAVTVWGANFVRIPLNQDRWLGVAACGCNQAAYQGLVAGIVNWCYANNVYVLLDLHWNDLGQSGVCASGQHDMPDENSVTFWQSVASTFANNPAVFFDLYNEPGGSNNNGTSVPDTSQGWSFWRNGGTDYGDNVNGVDYPYQSPGMQGLLTAIRGTGANNMVWAGGVNWAFNLDGLSSYNDWLQDTASGLGVVYATHIYPWKQGGGGCLTQACFEGTDNPATQGAVPPMILSSTHPVAVTEFGAYYSPGQKDPATGAYDSPTFVPNLLSWIESNNLSYSAWDMSTGSCPCVVSTYYTPTSPFGTDVQAALASAPAGGCPSPTQTPSPSPSATSGPSLTASPTFSVSPTASPTFTISPTFTASPTASPYQGTGLLPRVFPNPFHPAGGGELHFDHLEAGSTLNFFDVVGKPVWTFKAVGDPENDVWNAKNFNGLMVATGMYIVLVRQPSGRRDTLRLAVIE